MTRVREFSATLGRFISRSIACRVEAASPRRRAGLPFLAGLVLFLAAFHLSAKEPFYIYVPGLIPEPTNTPAASNSVVASLQSTKTNSPVAVSTNAMDDLDDKHILAIGDRLSFRIKEDEEEPKSLLIADSGELELPYLGRFPAENKTCKQLALEIKKSLEKDYYYQATVLIAVDTMAKSRGKVYVVGPVRVPGPLEIPSDEVFTLSKAILRAGGFTDYADRKDVKVTRQEGGADKQTFVVDVAQILDQGRTEQDLPLRPGDLIYVPERMIRF